MTIRLQASFQSIAFVITLAATLFGTAGRFDSSNSGSTLPSWRQSRFCRSERDHTVISDGPYRFVRHPGYTAALLAGVTSGIALGSWISNFIALG